MICLGQLLSILFFPFKGMVKKRQERIIEAYIENPKSVSDSEAHMILKDLAWKEYQLGNFDEAKKYSNELLRLNKIVDENWNYGNAIHHAHTIIGLVSFENNDIISARNHLNKSSKTPGSPQLDSFGPVLILAQKMIEAGEIEPCKKFLKNCKKFWKMEDGKISAWLLEIDNGHIPQMYVYQ